MIYLNCIDMDWTVFWTAATAIATLLLVGVGYIQLKDLNRTNKEIFLINLKKEFFTDQARLLMFLIEQDALVFETKTFTKGDEKGELLIFKNALPENVMEYLKPEWKEIEKSKFTTHEVDDFLLQHLEDVGLLLKKKIIKPYDAEQSFGYYACKCYESKPVREYIEEARKDDTDIYSSFQYLYEELTKQDKS